MSLDFYLVENRPVEVWESSITHNLAKMAAAAGLYEALWRSEDRLAADLIPVLKSGLRRLRRNPAKYRKYDSPNGWGTYDDFVRFVTDVLAACKANPRAKVGVCR